MGDASTPKPALSEVLPFRTPRSAEESRPGQFPVTPSVFDLRRLYRAHWQELCRYVSHTFGAGPPEPEDVVQLAFTRYAALDSPERIQNPRAFLFTMVRNIVLDYRRSQDRADRYARDALAQAGAAPLQDASPERVVMEWQRFDAINAALKKLPLKQQQVLAMSRVHGMTYEEIASRTGWSLADISRQLVRAVAALDAALKEMESP
ncbi:RNA polymerase sigma factor [Peristeroidobacter soli]|uniref:RNA polymerase sigma factor n=1 Tax=Peristeroidobacter soli TaxID=2497877 RepID=UPI0013009002|nr:sigma-70 family RNA polymerase sigma factor [Peristeroidobacter soli]